MSNTNEDKRPPVQEKELPHLSEMTSEHVAVLVRPDNNDDIEVIRAACAEKVKQIEAMGTYLIKPIHDPEYPSMIFKWQLYEAKDEKHVVRYHAIIFLQRI